MEPQAKRLFADIFKKGNAACETKLKDLKENEGETVNNIDHLKPETHSTSVSQLSSSNSAIEENKENSGELCKEFKMEECRLAPSSYENESTQDEDEHLKQDAQWNIISELSRKLVILEEENRLLILENEKLKNREKKYENKDIKDKKKVYNNIDEENDLSNRVYSKKLLLDMCPLQLPPRRSDCVSEPSSAHETPTASLKVSTCTNAPRSPGILGAPPPTLQPGGGHNYFKKHSKNRATPNRHKNHEFLTAPWKGSEAKSVPTTPCIMPGRHRFYSHNEDPIVRTIRSILNKLTLEKFHKLVEDIISLDLSDSKRMEAIVTMIFDKSISQHHFTSMYVDLIERLLSRNSEMKKILLNECQDCFEKYLKVYIGDHNVANEDDEQYFKYKQQMLGNIKLVGELINRGLLASKITIRCTNRLMELGTEAHIETLCALWLKIGPIWDKPESKLQINQTLDRMKDLLKQENVSKRSKCLIKNLLDIRAAKWEGAEQIAAPTRAEARAKQK
eukprot:GHVL01019985.1.p1 GENE.GHVL01019985.1~~GHVL01019985.1.p1  ORF type:complete len:506 (-),score=127.32 GHVL01019985.1:229-1746(-)